MHLKKQNLSFEYSQLLNKSFQYVLRTDVNLCIHLDRFVPFSSLFLFVIAGFIKKKKNLSELMKIFKQRMKLLT